MRLFMRADAQQLSLSTKLPQSGQVALLLPFATPTGYGLGKAGWVSASQPPPVEMLCSWVDESDQAVARQAGLHRRAAPGERGASEASTRERSTMRVTWERSARLDG